MSASFGDSHDLESPRNIQVYIEKNPGNSWPRNLVGIFYGKLNMYWLLSLRHLRTEFTTQNGMQLDQR